MAGSSEDEAGGQKRVSKVDPYRHLLSEETDAEIARRAGIHTETVRQYRIRHGIAPFAAGAGAASRSAVSLARSAGATVQTGAEQAQRPRGRPRKVRSENADEAPAAPKRRGRPPGSPRKVPASASIPDTSDTRPRLRKGGQPSAIDAFCEHLGQVPDGEIASMAGVTRAAVYQYRRHRGIEMLVGRTGASLTAPMSPAASAAAPESDSAQSVPNAALAKVEPFEALVNARSGAGYVYVVVVRSGDVDRSYGVIGWDIAEASAKAARTVKTTNGRIVSVTEHLEALG